MGGLLTRAHTRLDRGQLLHILAVPRFSTRALSRSCQKEARWSVRSSRSHTLLGQCWIVRVKWWVSYPSSSVPSGGRLQTRIEVTASEGSVLHTARRSVLRGGVLQATWCSECILFSFRCGASSEFLAAAPAHRCT